MNDVGDIVYIDTPGGNISRSKESDATLTKLQHYIISLPP